ncbi:MAG TPA: hypothetical protein VKQ36_08960 [Ktedonobacterales bacterium]|nr:hypothetical protein [Ktedonobacterales bacterium]
MSSATIYRLSGIALLIGGIFSAAGNIGQALDSDAFGPLWIPASLAIAIGFALILLGLPALYSRQMKQAGLLGLIGFALFFAACVQFGGGGSVTDLILLPWVTRLAVGALNNPPLAFILYYLISKILILAGSVVFGIALFRADVLSKGAALLLPVGSILLIAGGRVPYLEYIGETLFFAALAWLGASLLSALRTEASPAPSPVSASARA